MTDKIGGQGEFGFGFFQVGPPVGLTFDIYCHNMYFECFIVVFFYYYFLIFV